MPVLKVRCHHPGCTTTAFCSDMTTHTLSSSLVWRFIVFLIVFFVLSREPSPRPAKLSARQAAAQQHHHVLDSAPQPKHPSSRLHHRLRCGKSLRWDSAGGQQAEILFHRKLRWKCASSIWTPNGCSISVWVCVCVCVFEFPMSRLVLFKEATFHYCVSVCEWENADLCGSTD